MYRHEAPSLTSRVKRESLRVCVYVCSSFQCVCERERDPSVTPRSTDTTKHSIVGLKEGIVQKKKIKQNI